MDDKDLLTDEDEQRIQILKSMPIKKAIWKLSLPMVLSMLIQSVYSMTDMFFIGKLDNPHKVAAIALCIPVIFLIQAISSIFSTGGASLISRLLGEDDLGGASRAGAISFWTAFVVVVVAAIAGYIYMEPLIRLAGASEDTLVYCLRYLKIMFIAAPFMGMQFTMNGLLRAEGATKQAMIGTVLGSVINIILDPIFIFVFKMDVQGAAVSSLVGNLIGFSYLIHFYTGKTKIISISPKNVVFEGKYYLEVLKIGVPASLGMILMSFAAALANVYAAGFSDLVVAANGIAFRAIEFPFMFILAVSQGCQPIIGFNYGANNFKRMMDVISIAIKTNLAVSIGLCGVFFAFANHVLMLFITDSEVIKIGTAMLRRAVLALPFTALEMVIVVVFQSLGKGIQSLILSIGRQGLFYLPALIVFSNLWGVNGFMWAMPISDVSTGLLAVVLYIFFIREFKKRIITADQVI